MRKLTWASQELPVAKNLPANTGDIRDLGSILGSGRSPEGGNVNLLQDSCLENPMDRGAWRATVHGITKSQTRLSNGTNYIYMCLYDMVTHTYICVFMSVYIQYVCVCVFVFYYTVLRSVVSDSVTPWTVARQAPPSVGFSRQEQWSGLPCPPPVPSSRASSGPRDLIQVSALQTDCLPLSD